jgi:hypothetical protein
MTARHEKKHSGIKAVARRQAQRATAGIRMARKVRLSQVGGVPVHTQIVDVDPQINPQLVTPFEAVEIVDTGSVGARICTKCGREGQRGFTHHENGFVVCSSEAACRKRISRDE